MVRGISGRVLFKVDASVCLKCLVEYTYAIFGFDMDNDHHNFKRYMSHSIESAN